MYTHFALVPTLAVKQAGQDAQPDTIWHIESDADRKAILDQLERLLASPVFRTSRRLSSFLRYIVEETLANGGGNLKERTIGVNVFGRAPDYDTSGEPVVRVSAGDLRKRIAQYYHEPGRDNELRIDLPIGSYHPVFHLPAAAFATLTAASAMAPFAAPDTTTRETAVAVELDPEPRPAVSIAPMAQRNLRSLRFYGLAVLAALLGGAAIISAIKMPGNAYDQFWKPVVDSPGPVLVYVGARQDDDRMVFEDAVALGELSGMLRARDRAFRILKPSDATPEVLKQGPSLLIGGFTNAVARRLTQQLRFTFATDDAGPPFTGYIQDRQNLNRRDWSVPKGPLGTPPTFTDYAIVTRVIDPVTDKIAVVSAGIRKYGTLEAAEFLSHPEQIEAITRGAPWDWRKKDMQAVLAIDVKDGKSGPARLVARYFW